MEGEAAESRAADKTRKRQPSPEQDGEHLDVENTVHGMITLQL